MEPPDLWKSLSLTPSEIVFYFDTVGQQVLPVRAIPVYRSVLLPPIVNFGKLNPGDEVSRTFFFEAMFNNTYKFHIDAFDCPPSLEFSTDLDTIPATGGLDFVVKFKPTDGMFHSTTPTVSLGTVTMTGDGIRKRTSRFQFEIANFTGDPFKDCADGPTEHLEVVFRQRLALENDVEILTPATCSMTLKGLLMAIYRASTPTPIEQTMMILHTLVGSHVVFGIFVVFVAKSVDRPVLPNISDALIHIQPHFEPDIQPHFESHIIENHVGRIDNAFKHQTAIVVVFLISTNIRRN
ncbi:hypothetical protein BLNAU_15157 [Blattamonas nauphoetae]|uniref:Uncharacterized protein n=1 Tax=Blattamonas nauphoetae TaxID=2049346 RepID=A0ABQ9XBN0_9EUKA|nr:hypothetical protein BLNAU_15157 [Blattamonas nauphoetae]